MQLSAFFILPQGGNSFQYPRSDRRRCNYCCDEYCCYSCPFQYPRSDRRRCNPPPPKRSEGGAALSVSSVGSEAMQRISRNAAFWGLFIPFSILGRIGGDATSARTARAAPPGKTFQYPRSDRRRCNQELEHMQVSGTVPFQYPRSDRRRCNWKGSCSGWSRSPTFSILGRIGGDATLNCEGYQANAVPNFQYPRSDRRRCNSNG